MKMNLPLAGSIGLLGLSALLAGCAGHSGLPDGPYRSLPQTSARTPVVLDTTMADALRCTGQLLAASRHKILFLVDGVLDSTIPSTTTAATALSSKSGRAFIVRALTSTGAPARTVQVMTLTSGQFKEDANKKGTQWVAQLGVDRIVSIGGGYTELDRLASKGAGFALSAEGRQLGGQGSGDDASSIDRIGIDLTLEDAMTNRVLSSVAARIEAYKDNRSFKIVLAGKTWGIGAGLSTIESDGIHAQQRVVTEFATLILLGNAFGISVEPCLQPSAANAGVRSVPAPAPRHIGFSPSPDRFPPEGDTRMEGERPAGLGLQDAGALPRFREMGYRGYARPFARRPFRFEYRPWRRPYRAFYHAPYPPPLLRPW